MIQHSLQEKAPYIGAIGFDWDSQEVDRTSARVRISAGCIGWLLLRIFVVAVIGSSTALAEERSETGRPNILWITYEDASPNLGCYGDQLAATPNIDRVAGRGMKYARAWSNAPVCAPARTAIISGVSPTSTGALHMRSEVAVPQDFAPYPALLRENGYYCTNRDKDDYNIHYSGRLWDEIGKRAHWRGRPDGRPFLAVFNHAASHESRIQRRMQEQPPARSSTSSDPAPHDPAQVQLPPYHPDTAEARGDWAHYYDTVSTVDRQIGQLLDELERDGLADETIVFIYSDHGAGMPRSKRFAYNSGLQVPLIIYVPEKWRHLAPADYEPGGTSKRLVSFVDLAPTVLSLAGVLPPTWMQGSAFMGEYAVASPSTIHGFRGRMDERYDCVRATCDGRYVYVRNYMPHLPHGQHVSTMFKTATTRVWKKHFDQGQLTEAQQRFWQPKPAEELYDLASDPHEIANLVDSEAHRTVLSRMRQAHREQLIQTRDIGLLPEAEMHRRALAARKSIYEVGHDNNVYPIERVLDAAELASRRQEGDLGEVQGLLDDSDPGVRYWALIGILLRGESAAAKSRELLREALDGENPDTRIVAAQTLAKYGTPSDVDRALNVLCELSDCQTQNVYVAITALNALDALGPAIAPVIRRVERLPRQSDHAPKRANGYVQRLIDRILFEHAS